MWQRVYDAWRGEPNAVRVGVASRARSHMTCVSHWDLKPGRREAAFFQRDLALLVCTGEQE